MPYAYQDDTGKKDQVQAFLDEGFTPPMPDKDSLATMAATTPVAREDGRTYKTPSKGAMLITARATLIPCRPEDTSMRPDYGGGLDDDPVLV
jgi:hypothetical protein